MKKITTIGGGSGQYALLAGLRDLEGVDISSIVSMVDSGGSTGRLRDEYGILPPGDILKCILALSDNRETAREILQRRFKTEGKLNGHTVGNMLLTILSQYAGSFSSGVQALGETLDIKGKVLPVTTDKATLVAELDDGNYLYGETAIDVPKGGRSAKIKRTFLVPHHSDEIKVYPPVLEAIGKADFLIIGPGDLYTSITPNFLVSGVKEAIFRTPAKIIYAVNIMTKHGETDNFTGRDFILNLEKFIERKIDVAILNSARPNESVMREYENQKAKFVEFIDEDLWDGRKIINKDLLNSSGDIARHSSKKLADAINKIINGQL